MFDAFDSKGGAQSERSQFDNGQFADTERTTTEDGSNDLAEPYSDEDEDGIPTKRPKLNEDEKIQKCRERNRIHARNTRERKRAQMDLLQQRIQELSDEKAQLEEFEPEVSVASILMSLSGSKNESGSKPPGSGNAFCASSSSRTFAAETMDRIRAQISATLSDDEELELGSEFQIKDKTQCYTQELETIRRERNRMHAKKTRLRKKKILTEMEGIITTLESDIRELKRKHDLLPRITLQQHLELTQKPAARPTKFTGFRHMQNKVLGGVTVIDGLRQAQQHYVNSMEAQRRSTQHTSQAQMHQMLHSGGSHHTPNSMWHPMHMSFNYGSSLGGQMDVADQSALSASLLPTNVVLAPTTAKPLESVPSGISVTSTSSGETTGSSSHSSTGPSNLAGHGNHSWKGIPYMGAGPGIINSSNAKQQQQQV